MALRHFGLLAFLLTLLAVSAVGARGQTRSPYRVVGYYSSWSIYARGYLVTDIPAALLTHINYAFFNVTDEGECALGDPWADVEHAYPDDEEANGLQGNFRQLQLLKEAHPHLQTLMAVGGWTWSGNFSDAARTGDSRARLARSCLALMTEYGFDGIDLDWEYPGGGSLEGNTSRPEDTENFTLLLAEFRRQLDEQGELDGRPYLLTVAAPAGRQRENMELDKIHEYLDWINLAAYDFSGSWSEWTSLHAPLYSYQGGGGSADSTVRAYLAAGVPAEKIVLGVPFYGRAWGGVPDVNDGLGQPYEDVPGEGGFFDYGLLEEVYMGLHQRFWHDEALAPWLYSPDTALMITYDDPESLTLKANYARDNGLGGVMIWELAGDDDEHRLLAALHEALNAETDEE